MTLIDFKKTSDTDLNPSPGIWGDCPMNSIIMDGKGFYFFDDFQSFEVPAAGADTEYGRLRWFLDSGATVVSGAEYGGSIIMTEATDDEGIGMRVSPECFQISSTKGNFWCETRLKVNTIANDKFGFFFGLHEPITMTETVPIAADGTLNNENFVGFHRLESDGDTVDTVYKADGVTQVTVEEDAWTLEAGVYKKLGFKSVDGKITWYGDGTPSATTYALPTTASGTDFPADVLLAPMFAMLLEATETATVEMSMFRFAQLY